MSKSIKLNGAVSVIGLVFVLAISASLFMTLPQTLLEAQSQNTTADLSRSPIFYPNTENVKPNEMRITALGTGLPTPLTRAQKSSAWMVELGDGIHGKHFRPPSPILQARQDIPEPFAYRSFW